MKTTTTTTTTSTYNPHKTAIGRSKLSRPVSYLLGHGLIKSTDSIVDYGAGKGDDTRLLRALGFNDITPFDKYQKGIDVEPTNLGDVDVMFCNFVLNVIHSVEERIELLGKLGQGRCVYLSVRMDTVKGEACEDGVITVKGTFQTQLLTVGAWLNFFKSVGVEVEVINSVSNGYALFKLV